MKKTYSALVVVSLVLAFLAGTHTACPAAESIKVGVIYPLTGGAAADYETVDHGRPLTA